MFEQLLVNLLQGVDTKKMKTLMHQLEAKKNKSKLENMKLFKKILKFCKLQNSLYCLLFGVSEREYQNRVLNLVYKIGKWLLKKYKESAYPKLTFDKTLSNILTEFNNLQEEQEKEDQIEEEHKHSKHSYHNKKINKHRCNNKKKMNTIQHHVENESDSDSDTDSDNDNNDCEKDDDDDDDDDKKDIKQSLLDEDMV
jgi:hypothetical protein